VARALATLPLLAQALARGELSYAKVRALTRVATPETETRLLGVGRGGTAAHVERIVRGWRRWTAWRRRQRTSACEPVASYPTRTHDGDPGRLAEAGVVLRLTRPAKRCTAGARVGGDHAETALEDALAWPAVADALSLLAETALHHGLDPHPGRAVPGCATTRPCCGPRAARNRS
jgi:hypothetical protein